jgi:hypothetical protein
MYKEAEIITVMIIGKLMVEAIGFENEMYHWQLDEVDLMNDSEAMFPLNQDWTFVNRLILENQKKKRSSRLEEKPQSEKENEKLTL